MLPYSLALTIYVTFFQQFVLHSISKNRSFFLHLQLPITLFLKFWLNQTLFHYLKSPKLLSSTSVFASTNFIFFTSSFLDPFEIQTATGCELHPGGTTVGFSQFAYQGSELVHFQNNSWLPSIKNETKAQQACRLFNQGHVINKVIHRLLSDTCPRFLFSVRDTGKADLQKKGQSHILPPKFF